MKGWIGTIGHFLVTLALCPFGFGWIAAGFFVGRELAQAEYRYIEAHGGKRYACPVWCGFYPSAWTIKSLFDWLVPLVTATAWTLLR